MERTVTFCFVWFSMKRLIMLRSPLTTSGDADQSPSVASDGRVEGTRTTKGIVGRESACDLEPSLRLWLWLCYHRLFCDYVRVRTLGVILSHSLDAQRETHKQKRREW